MRIIRLAVNKVLNLHILTVQFAFSISNKVFSLHKMSVGFFSHFSDLFDSCFCSIIVSS